MKRKAGVLFILVGLVALVIAGGLWLNNSLEDETAAKSSEIIAQAFLEKLPNDSSHDTLHDNVPGDILPDDENTSHPVSDIDMEHILIDGVKYIGIINIPRFDLNLPVRMNWSYEALKLTPCRYSGNITDNTLVISAHNYSAHFADIGRMRLGDTIIITDVNSFDHTYEVVVVFTVDPESVYEVTHSIYDLTLFTCTFGGQARVVVRANRVNKIV